MKRVVGLPPLHAVLALHLALHGHHSVPLGVFVPVELRGCPEGKAVFVVGQARVGHNKIVRSAGEAGIATARVASETIGTKWTDATATLAHITARARSVSPMIVCAHLVPPQRVYTQHT